MRHSLVNETFSFNDVPTPADIPILFLEKSF